MKVLLVCPAGFKTGKTGDATQARETIAALGARNHKVRVLYVQSYVTLVFEDSNGKQVRSDDIKALIQWCEVIHLLPCNPQICRFWRQFPHRPMLGSSIFWAGWERVIIAGRVIRPLRSRLHRMIRYLLQELGLRLDYRGVDVFLPNTRAEGECVMGHFKTSRGARFFPVPTGFVVPPFPLEELPRPNDVPEEDYMVVPGVFAWRKNQLGLIRALRDFPHPVVFMGDALDSEAEGPFLEDCKRAASQNMRFIGYKPSSSEEYWAVLRYARCACLASDCETPGISLLEAAYAGARPVVTKFGGTLEYYGFDGEYFNPCKQNEITAAVARGWKRGRLNAAQAASYRRFSWRYCAENTIQAYRSALTM